MVPVFKQFCVKVTLNQTNGVLDSDKFSDLHVDFHMLI